MVDDKKVTKTKRSVIWIVAILVVIIVASWFGLTTYNYSRVKSDKKPILCFGNSKEIEANNEYSKACYGIFYKYKEYYSTNNDVLTAREFTLFFKEFDRK